MERYQNAIVVTVIAVFVLLIAGALIYSQRGANVPAQRFRAAPGTERANAQPIYSERTDRDEGGSGGAAPAPAPGGHEEPAVINVDAETAAPAEPVWIIVPRDAPSAGETPVPGADAPVIVEAEADALLQRAGLAPTPSEGLRLLAEGAGGMAAASGVYSAAARLYMRLDPPDSAAAVEMMQRAIETASSPDERGEAVLTQAQLLVDGGESERAMAYLETTLAASEDAGPASLRARLLLGSIYESFGRADDAKAAYAQAESAAADLLAAGAAGAGDAYRQAAWRLSRFHTAQGDAEAAAAVVARMNERLGTGAPPPS